jgi:predicted nucleic acid-binding protein
VTQNGFVRVMSQPRYPQSRSPIEAVAALQTGLDQPDHAFWPDDISITDQTLFDHGRILGPNQITDIYLLGLAVENGGRLVTFDRGLPTSAVRGAEPRHLVVL